MDEQLEDLFMNYLRVNYPVEQLPIQAIAEMRAMFMAGATQMHRILSEAVGLSVEACNVSGDAINAYWKGQNDSRTTSTTDGETSIQQQIEELGTSKLILS